MAAKALLFLKNMEHIRLDNILYQFTKDFKHSEEVRLSFNRLTQKVFEFSLESWYQSGSWGDYYIPYSLLHNDVVISNVSVNVLEFSIGNEVKTGLQIGTVMTDEKYRNRGLNKMLLEKVISDWKEKSDFIYLFANDSVLDFYPKFGFERISEYQHSKLVEIMHTKTSFRKLNVDDQKDHELLMDTINQAVPISKVSMRNNASLIMFYCQSYKKNSIFYIDKLEAVVIGDFIDETLYLNDVFSKTSIDLDNLVQLMSGKNIERVVLGFTPLDDTNYKRSLLKGADVLFMLKDNNPNFMGNYWMFPTLSHA